MGLVLERLHQSLYQAVFNKERKLSLVEKIEFAKDIASGLFFLHNEKGIIHRDIKPRNILVLFLLNFQLINRKIDKDYLIAKISDFGESRLVGRKAISTTVRALTPAYSAPEVLDGKELLDDKIDIYSFGILLYVIFMY